MSLDHEELKKRVMAQKNPWKHWIEELCVIHWVVFDENDAVGTIARLHHAIIGMDEFFRIDKNAQPLLSSASSRSLSDDGAATLLQDASPEHRSDCEASMKPCIHLCSFYHADGTLHSQSVNTTFVPDEAGAKMIDGVYKGALLERLQAGDAGSDPKTCIVERGDQLIVLPNGHELDVQNSDGSEALTVDELKNLSDMDVAKVQTNLLVGFLKFGQDRAIEKLQRSKQ